MRGLWPGVEGDLRALGFSALTDLRGQKADALAVEYCRRLHRPEDPLMAQYFSAIVKFAETGSAVPWWKLYRAEAASRLEKATGGKHLKPKHNKQHVSRLIAAASAKPNRVTRALAGHEAI